MDESWPGLVELVMNEDEHEESRLAMEQVRQVARKWVCDVQSGRKLGAGDKMQMHDLVHHLVPLVRDGAKIYRIWRAFEACVNLGVEQLLGSPSNIRTHLAGNIHALAHFHLYAQALCFGFSPVTKILGARDVIETISVVLPNFIQRLGHQDRTIPTSEGNPVIPIGMGAILKHMLQDQLYSPMGAEDVKRMESLLLPLLAAHPASSDWLLPGPYAFVPLPSKFKLTFVLCSKRAESPVSRLSITMIERILGLARHLRFGGECSVVAAQAPGSNIDEPTSTAEELSRSFCTVADVANAPPQQQAP
jgi:hypothetical protein